MGGYEKACEIITEHRDSLEKMALALLDRETLNAAEIKDIIDGKIPPADGQETKTKPEGVVSSSEKTQSKADDDSGEIMGGGLPDPHPV